jgi:hypothetical protein
MLDKYSMPQKLQAKSGGRLHVMPKPAGSTCNLGLDLYRRVVALQKHYAKPNQRVENDLHTKFPRDAILGLWYNYSSSGISRGLAAQSGSRNEKMCSPRDTHGWVPAMLKCRREFQ